MSLSPSKRNVYELDDNKMIPSSDLEARWEEGEGTYRHKKFKKTICVPPPPPAPAPSFPEAPLKHSALSMVNSEASSDLPSSSPPPPPRVMHPLDSEGDKRRKQHFCPYCPTACAKPSVLDKHIRTHTNERPFPCDPCGFAFKTKSNLYKHRKSRTHILKLETGIDSSGAEIVAELGESVQEEMESFISTLAPSYQQPQVHPRTSPFLLKTNPLSSSSSSPDERIGSDYHPSQIILVSSSSCNSKSTTIMSSSDPSRRPVPIATTSPLVNNSQRIINPSSAISKPPVQMQPTDLSSSSSKPGHPQSLQQRIDKVISENQAIVETLDPLWPRRYMRQNSKDEDKSGSSSSNLRGSRKYSSPINASPPSKPAGDFPRFHPGSYSPSSVPLNLSSSEPSRKRSFTQSESSSSSIVSNITAKSVKELWLNSCRRQSSKNANMEQLEVIAQNLEAGNAFHPQNPEGSMIKELLLNTRHVSNDSPPPLVNPPSTVIISKQSTVIPPIKKKLFFVAGGGGAFCNLCSSSVRGSDIDTHQRLYCSSLAKKARSESPPQQQGYGEQCEVSKGGLLQIAAAVKKAVPKSLEIVIPGGILKKRPAESSDLPPRMLVTSSSSSTTTTTTILSLPKADLKVDVESEREGKFLRPSFLPLTPGSFRPKKNIMQIGNGATLVSPETPRPRKSYVLQYQNGTAYTYLGLKSTTRVYFCSIFRPQPMFVPHKPRLSMYSNWRVVSKDSHPSKLTPSQGLAAYNSSYKNSYVMANNSGKGEAMIMTHSSLWKKKPSDKAMEGSRDVAKHHLQRQICSLTTNKEDEEGSRGSVEGGYKTTDDDYTYVRGRGRGRYVCNSCGIRCKKPSMLKKHLRTHSNFRPYMCRYCNFAFKTKGNLTKHMKSKAHHKKCVELGISPDETSCQVDEVSLGKQGVTSSSGFQAGDSDSEDEDFDEDEDDEDDQFEDAEEETEAAHSLLSLSHPKDNRGLTPFSLRLSITPFVLSSASPLTSITSLTSSMSINSISEHVSRNTQRAGEYQEDENSKSVQFSLDKIYFPPPSTSTSTSFSGLQSMSSSSCTIVTQSYTSKSIIRKEESPEPALQDYLRERAVMKASGQQQSPSAFVNARTDPPAVTSSSSINEAPPPPLPPRSSIVSIGIPRNVVMNVKDIPNSKNESGLLINPPEIVVPRGSKALPPFDESSSSSSSNGSSSQDIFQTNEEGKSVCGICHKVFSKPSQLRLHVNIHYFERPFRCDACAVSFRTKGHLQKHKRSVGHYNKVNINATFGAPTTANPRPFKCSDCKVAFRIHGHLAKHLRSKMHIMKLECSGKLPIGMFAEMERLGTNLNEIDTSDCENSLESLQQIAVKLYKKDPSKLTAPEDGAISAQASDISDNEEEHHHVVTVQQQASFTPSPSVKSEVVDESPSSLLPHFREHLAPPSSITMSPAPLPPSIAKPPPPPSRLEEPIKFDRSKLFHCSSCKISFNDIKSLQVHNYVEHTVLEHPKQQQTDIPQCSITSTPSTASTTTTTTYHHSLSSPFEPLRPHHRIPHAGAAVAAAAAQAAAAANPKRRSPFNNPPRDDKTASYECELCGVSILGANPFSQHLMSHAAPRPYVCSHCDAGFPSTRQLEAHMQLHAKN